MDLNGNLLALNCFELKIEATRTDIKREVESDIAIEIEVNSELKLRH